MDLLKFVKDKGVFVKCRIGGPMFNPANQKRTTAKEDILGKRNRSEQEGAQVSLGSTTPSDKVVDNEDSKTKGEVR